MPLDSCAPDWVIKIRSYHLELCKWGQGRWTSTGTQKHSEKKDILVCQAAIIKYHSLSGLNNRSLVLTFLEAQGPRSRCWQVWFFLGPLGENLFPCIIRFQWPPIFLGLCPFLHLQNASLQSHTNLCFSHYITFCSDPKLSWTSLTRTTVITSDPPR